jgi:hypothetical protein
MEKYLVEIQSAHYGGYNYAGAEKDILINEEYKSVIQILSLILKYPILNKLYIDSNYYAEPNKSELIKVIYNKIKKGKVIEIRYWNNVNWSESTITIEKV